jgi:circadian clock protein KaiC
MKKKIQIIPSGISLVDKAWGGFYRGGTYLLIGQRKSGRTLLGLQYAMETAKQKEVCLYFTNMRPKDLMIHAASIDFDLQSYMNQNLIIVVRVAAPSDLGDIRNPDNFLVEYIKDIVTVVDQYFPSRIIFDELTPFIGFRNLALLQNTFLQTIETIEERGITSLFVLGEPATAIAQSIVDTLAQYSTAIIYLQKRAMQNGKGHGGKMTITPNIGHTEGQFSANYSIEPYKGVTVDYQPENNFYISSNPENSANVPLSTPMDFPQLSKPATMPNTLGYRSLSNIDIPTNENVTFSNYYDLNDFSLILNNQIALYKSTGQLFSLIAFKLDKVIEQQGLLSINQLQNAVRLSTDKKDKICVVNNKVIVLMTKEEQKNINGLIGKIKGNLPGNDPNYINTVVKYISVITVTVDEKTENADHILQHILVDEPKNQSELGFY